MHDDTKFVLNTIIGTVLLIFLFLSCGQEAKALDVGVGIGLCEDGIVTYPRTYCKAGHIEKAFVRHIHMVNESFGVEGEIYHFSHFEDADIHGEDSKHLKSAGTQGVSFNIFYRIF